MNPEYKAGWVHQDICERLERFSDDVKAEKSPRLMLLMPPRHGKSELASRAFPAWHLGRFPNHEFIACSYNMDLAVDFSRKVKGILELPEYQNVFLETRLDPENRSAEKWVVHGKRGGYVAAGVGGGITGRGAHVLVIDDPIKAAEDADSADNREKLWQWYLSTAYSRLAPGGGVLIIQTWWHDDDLAGRLQTMMKDGHDDIHVDQFEVIKYPAIAESDEYYDNDTRLIVDMPPDNGHLLRSKGEALHPERYDLNKLLRIKAQNAGGRWWSALYQQNPVPDDGAYFTKDHFVRTDTPRKEKCNIYIAWDFAISEKKQSDYTVGTVGLQDDNDMLHVAEQVRFKSGDALFIVEAILNLAERWYSPNLLLGFEDGQIWRAIEALLKKRMRERRVYPSITVLKPITDKMARARPLQGRMQQGMVQFARHGEWYDACRQEMLRFPAGAHDDCVDSLAWMATMAIGRQPPQRPKHKEPESWRNKLKLTNNERSHMGC
jgi:predicted phage terminase large subunit-like protein